jgi:N,N-dimethylformamidase
MLTGYTDKVSAAPGERIEFKLSSDEAFDLTLVRLIQGDATEAGPGYLEEELDASCNGCYPAQVQRTDPGSFVRVDDRGCEHPTGGLTLMAWVRPTSPGKERQGVLTRWSADGTGYGLELVRGVPCFAMQFGDQRLEVRSPVSVTADWWQVLAAGFDARSGRLFLWHAVHDPLRRLERGAYAETRRSFVELPEKIDSPMLIGAAASADGTGALMNGQIAMPRWLGHLLTEEDMRSLAQAPRLAASPDGQLGAWDLGPARPSTLVLDHSPRARHGVAINNPARGVRSHLWDGSADHPAQAPDHYSSMHFHADDLSDAAWETTATLVIPPDLTSGVYAARLRTRTAEDHIPFVVRPGPEAAARVCVVLPTLTYLAYANERFYRHPSIDWSEASDRPLRLDPVDRGIKAHPEFGPSLYDLHSDGSINFYSSRLRPILNYRPKVVAYWTDAGRHFVADLYLLSWLHREGIPVDVVADEDVDRDGGELLGRYDVVLTGSHPEYATEAMLDAYGEYLAGGGRMMYLGGNGFYWVTTLDPAAPHIMEVRKVESMGNPLPGETHHSQTGTVGGTWRSRGRSSDAWLGIGFSTQGFVAGAPYQRTPASYAPDVSWIFDGVENPEFGDFGLALGAAAGDEMDAAHPEFGTPPQTIVLASSDNARPYYLDLSISFYGYQEHIDRGRRADMTYMDTGHGGAVFAAGSMCWCTSLPCNDYDNEVARITRNVIRRFLRAGDRPDNVSGVRA